MSVLPDTVLSVGQVHRRAKNAIAREFRGPVWVEGELKTVREQRGNWYLTLIEPGDYADGGDISLDVACWARRKALVVAQLRSLGLELVAGMQVRIQGTVTLSKFDKVMIEMIALDTDALLGRQAAEKRRVYAALAAEGLIDANRRLPLPGLPLRVGLVSSEGSEGYSDFLGQLERSPYDFKISFFHSPVQGPSAATNVARAIESFGAGEVDVIAVVRGGGGELDAFDKEVVARAIASAPIPVFTGIGHTGDHVLADDVAHQAFITPTECGQGLVRCVDAVRDRLDRNLVALRGSVQRHVGQCEQGLNDLLRGLQHGGRQAVDGAHLGLFTRTARLRRSAERDLAHSWSDLDSMRRNLQRAAGAGVSRSDQLASVQALRVERAVARSLDRISADARLWKAQVKAIDPARQLRLGYSITRDEDGRLVRDVAGLRSGARLTTSFVRGAAVSRVESIDAEKENQ